MYITIYVIDFLGITLKYFISISIILFVFFSISNVEAIEIIKSGVIADSPFPNFRILNYLSYNSDSNIYILPVTPGYHSGDTVVIRGELIDFKKFIEHQKGSTYSIYRNITDKYKFFKIDYIDKLDYRNQYVLNPTKLLCTIKRAPYPNMVLLDIEAPTYSGYLINRDFHFQYGDTVFVSGKVITTEKRYDYPFLQLSSIKKYYRFPEIPPIDSTIITLRGTIFNPNSLHDKKLETYNLISYEIDNFRKYEEFESRDDVEVTGFISEYIVDTLRGVYRYKFHIKSIEAFNCCLENMHGDINLDGKVNLADFIALAAFQNGSFRMNICYNALDINGDSVFDNKDYEYFYEYLFNCGPAPVSCD